MPDVVNNCLGLTQYLTQHLGSEATSYLLCIEELSTDEWKSAKSILTNAAGIGGLPNRLTKEATIKDCVDIFVDNAIDYRYLVADLSLCPGFQPCALNLVSHTARTLFAVQRTTDSIARQAQSRDLVSLHNNFSDVAAAAEFCSTARLLSKGIPLMRNKVLHCILLLPYLVIISPC